MRHIKRLYHPDGRAIDIYAFGFGIARVNVGHEKWQVYDDEWHYESVDAAVKSTIQWINGGCETDEPNGWHRHPETGRRRPGGDPRKEYVRA